MSDMIIAMLKVVSEEEFYDDTDSVVLSAPISAPSSDFTKRCIKDKIVAVGRTSRILNVL